MKKPNIHSLPWEVQEYIQDIETKLKSMVSSSHVSESDLSDFKKAIEDINDRDNKGVGWGGNEIKHAFNCLLEYYKNSR